MIANVTGCGLPVFGQRICEGIPQTYFNAQQIVNCPAGFAGGPFTAPAGKFISQISQADADAQATAYLQALLAGNCAAAVPVVESDTETVGISLPFSYQIVATNSPTSYGATNLPAGLSLNTATGLITGTITSTAPASYSVGVSATNPGGTGNGTLTINASKVMSVAFGDSSAATLKPVVQISIDGGAFFTPNIGSSSTSLGTAYNVFSQLIMDVGIAQQSFVNGSSEGPGVFLKLLSAQTINVANTSYLETTATYSGGDIAGGNTFLEGQISNVIGIGNVHYEDPPAGGSPYDHKIFGPGTSFSGSETGRTIIVVSNSSPTPFLLAMNVRQVLNID